MTLDDNVRQLCSNTLKILEEEYFDNCITESIFIVLRCCFIQTLVLSLVCINVKVIRSLCGRGIAVHERRQTSHNILQDRT